ncbi:hypothetical protein NDU88_000984 [Pleurodeles waltl]|uniref:Uncharacterized protein n=1 Tax=Pleurodeles waltl TaxID=8319 RepID=A0AAV7V6X3_PLEWA|nr:hypothetical protein NDU88_000984 [Pleurodeles waltl]
MYPRGTTGEGLSQRGGVVPGSYPGGVEKEDVGPDREEPRNRAREEIGRETKMAICTELCGECTTTGQPRHVPGGMWLDKVQLYFVKKLPLVTKSGGENKMGHPKKSEYKLLGFMVAGNYY